MTTRSSTLVLHTDTSATFFVGETFQKRGVKHDIIHTCLSALCSRVIRGWGTKKEMRPSATAYPVKAVTLTASLSDPPEHRTEEVERSVLMSHNVRRMTVCVCSKGHIGCDWWMEGQSRCWLILCPAKETPWGVVAKLSVVFSHTKNKELRRQRQ